MTDFDVLDTVGFDRLENQIFLSGRIGITFINIDWV